jgi:hypothetical protein
VTLKRREDEFPLNLGMATKPSAELQTPETMRLVQNLHWRGLGEIEKRPTHGVSHAIGEPSGSVYDEDQACGLIVRENVPAVVTGRHGVMTYSEDQALAQWTRASVAASSTPDATLRYCPVSYEVSRRFVERSQFNKGATGIWMVTSAQHNGVQVIAWQEALVSASSRMWLKAISADTGAVLATSEYIALGSASGLRAQACEYTETGKEGVLIAYNDFSGAPNTIKTVRYDAASNSFVADSNLTTDYSGAFALVRNTSNSSRVLFGYHKDSTGRLIVEDRTISTINSTHTSTTHGADAGIAIVKGANLTLIVSCTSTVAGEAYAEVFTHPGDVITVAAAGGLADDVFLGVAAALESRVGATDSAVMWLQCYWTGSSVADAMRVRSFEINFDASTPVAGTASVLPHCQIVTNGFTLRGHAHVVLSVLTYVHGVATTIPTSCFVARYRASASSGRHDAVARICHDRYFLPSGFTFSIANSAYVDSSHNAWIVLQADPSAAALPGSPLPQTLFLERISAARPMPMPYAQPEPGFVLVAGGLPWVYDGDVASEATPLVPPKLLLDVSGVGTTSGTFSLIPVYRWVDAAGNVYRLPGAAVSTGAISNKDITAYVSMCPMRTYDGVGLADMEPEIYITEDEGSQYYLATASGQKLTYSSTAGEVWYVYDDVLPGSPSDPPYPFDSGAGGSLAPEPTPAFLHIAKVVDRMWAVDAEDRGRLWPSKPIVTGFGVEWSTDNTISVADDCVAVVAQGGGTIVLARGGIYLVTGEGPNALGVGGFDPAVKVSDVDCIDSASVCRTPMGVLFRGRRGFYLLNGTEVQPFGVPIDPEVLTDPQTDPSSTASYRMRAVFQEQTSEIHISGFPGRDRLIYNVLEQKWSKYDEPDTEVRDLVVARGKVWRLERAGGGDLLRDELLYSRSGAAYNSDATTISRITTPWLAPEDINGLFRVWRLWPAFALASDPADTSITVEYYADFDESAPLQSQTWTGAEIAATGRKIARLPFHVGKQLVHAFKVSLSWTHSGVTSGPKPLKMRVRWGAKDSKGKRLTFAVKG